MSTLKAHNIEPATGTDVALGAAGDSITVSGDSLKLDTFKDAGGNTLFTSDGSGTVSSVNSGLKGNGPILILSQTASNSSGIAFTSGIDSTYDKYMFVFTNLNPVTDTGKFQFQVSTDGGSSYGVSITSSVYRAAHSESGTSLLEIVNWGGYQLANSTSYQSMTIGQGSDTDEAAAGILYLYAPSSTTYVKQFMARFNEYHSSIYSMDVHTAGYVNSTSAVNAINFKFASGNFDGKIKMYGIA